MKHKKIDLQIYCYWLDKFVQMLFLSHCNRLTCIKVRQRKHGKCVCCSIEERCSVEEEENCWQAVYCVNILYHNNSIRCIQGVIPCYKQLGCKWDLSALQFSYYCHGSHMSLKVIMRKNIFFKVIMTQHFLLRGWQFLLNFLLSTQLKKCLEYSNSTLIEP